MIYDFQTKSNVFLTKSKKGLFLEAMLRLEFWGIIFSRKGEGCLF